MKLIDKDALVAMIKSRMATNMHENPLTASAYVEDEDILEAVDTLEVKEVDFDAEWKRYFEYRGDMATVNIKHLAKHFFELGMLSTITEEDCKLIWQISDEIPYMSEEDFFKEMLRRYKAQKGERL